MSLTISTTAYFFRHQLGTTPIFNLLFNVSFDGDWFMHNDPSMLFVMDGENVPEIHRTGNKHFYIGLTNDVNNYDEGFYELKLRVFSGDGLEEKELTVFLIVTESSDDVIMPKSVHFEAIRNVEEALSQKIYIATSHSGVQINLPAWLEIESHELIGGGHILAVKPVSHNLTPAKHYQDNIRLTIPSIPGTQNVVATYNINAGYDESFTKSVHFTEDNEELIFYKTTPEKSFLKLLIDIKSFKESGLMHRELELDLDFPFVNNFSKINIGKEIEPYFQKDSMFWIRKNIFGAYPPIELRITALEVKYDDFSILNQDILPVQYFLKGKNPLRIKNINLPFWADFRPNLNRVVSDQAVISLSVFKPAGKPIENIKMYVNNVFKELITPTTQSFGLMKPYFATAFIDLKQFDLKIGDEVVFELPEESQKKKYLIRQNQKNSFLICYQSPWNTFEIFEFTGSARYVTDYTHRTMETSKDYQSFLSKIESKNTQKLIINTGWIQKDENFILDELIRSARAFLLPNRDKKTPQVQVLNKYEAVNKQQIELVPIQSKLIDFDSDENIYQLDVEFNINPNYAHKIYS